MKFAQICDNRVHWIFEAEEKPVFAPYVVLIDITGRDDIQEGWSYNKETGEFSKPVSIENSIPETSVIQPSNQEINDNLIILMGALADMYETLLDK